MDTKEEVRRLWELCFHDSREFIDLYFRSCYTEQANIAVRHEGRVIAALQMLPYSMTCFGKSLRTAYVSGACTHPLHRNRGVMRSLLAEAFTRMADEGTALTTLIPAEPWLYHYYARQGYAAVFHAHDIRFTPSATSTPESNCTLQTTDRFTEDAYRYLHRKESERSCGMLHSAKDFEVILADMRISRGELFLLYRHEEITALAIACPQSDTEWHVGELAAESEAYGRELLHAICHSKQLEAVTCRIPPSGKPGEASGAPYGMARIIDAMQVLQCYAAAHPQLDRCIRLADPQLEQNNGYYHICHGECIKDEAALPGDCQPMSISELAELLLMPAHPYMSLMLN